MMERTLSIIKPDGVKANLIGEVIRRFENERLQVIALKMVQLNKEQAEGFYKVHRGKPFYKSLTEFMCSGPVVVMVLEGQEAIQKTRRIMGATDPSKADPGTIRSEFASNIEQNIVHGSDAKETAIIETAYLFNALEIHSH